MFITALFLEADAQELDPNMVNFCQTVWSIIPD